MRIDEALYRDTRCRDIPPNGRKQWQRMDCPYCGHSRAVISYEANWFQCWACGKQLSGLTSDPAALAVVRFTYQIDRAVRKIKADFGDWLGNFEDDWITGQAKWLVWNYAEGEPGKPNDAGMLPKWELDCNAEEEPWRLEAKVQSVLDRDMIDWAKGVKRWEEEHQYEFAAGDVGLEAKFNSDDDSAYQDDTKDKRRNSKGVNWDAKPFVPAGGGAGKRLRNKSAEIAIKFGGSTSRYFYSKEPPGTNLNSGPFKPDPLRRCNLMRNGAGPIAGHCAWCNKTLGLPATPPKGATDLMADEHDDLRRRYPYLVATEVDGYTVAELAKKQGVTSRTVERKITNEKRRLERYQNHKWAA